MFIYDINIPFDWKSPSWIVNPDMYSIYFNRLLQTKKSIMTEGQVIKLIDLSYDSVSYQDIRDKLKQINKNRVKMYHDFSILFEKFKKIKNKNEIEEDDLSAYYYYIQYVVHNNGGLDQLVMDAFPYESLFVMRY